MKENILEIKFPEVAKEWHPTKNGTLTPSSVTYGSNKKVWWQCSTCNNEWEAAIHERTKHGTNCPRCARPYEIRQFDSKMLSDAFPEVAKDWHPTKNGSLTPNNISFGSHKEVWWRCHKCEHEWPMRIDYRTRERSPMGCKYCKKQNITITHPHVALFWHPTKNGKMQPESVTHGSEKSVWWQCPECKLEWSSMVCEMTRAHKQHLCKKCSETKFGINHVTKRNHTNTILSNVDTLSLMFQNQWSPNNEMTISDFILKHGLSTKALWVCELGHEYDASISTRKQGSNCPFCSNKRVLAGYNDLATTHPQLALEWHPTKNGDLKPTDVPAGSRKNVCWVCENGHEWMCEVRYRKTRTCPACKNLHLGFERRGRFKYENLTITNPELLSEWDFEKNGDLLPENVSCGSNLKVFWKCNRGHTWRAQIASRAKGRKACCPICSHVYKTSYPEQKCFHFIQEVFPDAISGYKIPNDRKEIDIFIPSLNLGIEYDGERWHKDVERDIKKSMIIANQNISLIRIREHACPTINDSSKQFFVNPFDESSLNQCIVDLMQFLNVKTKIDVHTFDRSNWIEIRNQYVEKHA